MESPVQNESKHHVVLVPGFGGFDALGTLRYYHGVTEVLRAFGCVIHYFPNLPTASVQTRSQQLQGWLAALWERGALDESCAIHLVGHSTGGLDLRQFLIDCQQQMQAQAKAYRMPVFERVQSVQFISTPHRGTNLARWLSATRTREALCRLAVRALYEGARGTRELGVGWMGQFVQGLMSASARSDWIDAVVDTSAACYSRQGGLRSAHARANYFDMLRWLLHVTSDFSAIRDLSPMPPPGRKVLISPAHLEDSRPEADFLRERGIRVRSIVTVAPPPASLRPLTLFKVLYSLVTYQPPERFKQMLVPEMSSPNRRLLRPGDNDGLVNSVSQVWPDEESSFVVDGDHADVIGHFQYQAPQRYEELLPAYRQYDLLASGMGFGPRDFTALWRWIGDFIVREEAAPRAYPPPPAQHEPAIAPH